MLSALRSVAADDLAEEAVRVIEQRQLAVLELVEKLIPGNLDEGMCAAEKGTDPGFRSGGGGRPAD
jgi:hypothetical protein